MNIVFVGAGGAGVSALVNIFLDVGFDNIVCIDKDISQLTDKLVSRGANVVIGHDNYDVNSDDILIYSDATINTPEIVFAKENNIKYYSYFEFLGELSKHFNTISVAGTHGKSTTTSMLIDTFSQINPDFGIGIVGALMTSNQQNYLLNNNLNLEIKVILNNIVSGVDLVFQPKYYMIVEADEFNRHLLHLHSKYGIILNIELDHSDVFGNIDNYRKTFDQFVLNTSDHIFVLGDEPSVDFLNSDKITRLPTIKFDFRYIFGQHNIRNASLVYGLCKHINPGVSHEKIILSIQDFRGIWRRMEFLKNLDGVDIYTDYGHHPTELGAVYLAFRAQFPDRKLTAIFQPHQARRVLQFWDQFIDILSQFDRVVIYDIYIARENLDMLKKEFKNKNFDDINTVEELGTLFASRCGGNYITKFDQISNVISDHSDGDIVVFFSAGDIDYKLRKYLDI